MRVIHLSLAAGLFAGVLHAQPSTARAAFEVASIKPSSEQPLNNTVNVGLQVEGAQIRSNYVPLQEYIAMAYRLRPNQVIAPDWLSSQRFDVTAKIPDGVPADKLGEMFQSLLEERFQLKAHREKKELPVYGLVVTSGGLKIKPLPAEPGDPQKNPMDWKASGGASGISISFGPGSSFRLGDNRMEAKKVSMDELAEVLTYLVDRPVVDMTNTRDRYDVTVDLSPEEYRAILIRSAISRGVVLPPQAVRMLDAFPVESAFQALAAIGLKLESRKAPLEVLVVDSIARTPTAN